MQKKTFDYIINGGGFKEIACAKQLSEKGNDVLLLVTETYLGWEMTKTHRYDMPKNQWEDILKDLLPKNTWIKHNTKLIFFHPAKVKLHLEKICENFGIEFYYNVQCNYEEKEPYCVEIVGKFHRQKVYCKHKIIENRIQQNNPNTLAVHLSRIDQTIYDEKMLYIHISGSKYTEYIREALQKFHALKQKDQTIVLGRFGEIPFDDSTKIADAVKSGIDQAKLLLKNKTKKNLTHVKSPSLFHSYDVVIIGGGTSGTMAALHAARNGSKTLLIEMNYTLGGTGTVGGVSTYWFGNRYKDVQEVDYEVEQVSKAYGIEMKPGIWAKHDDFHPEVKSYVLTKMCEKSGVDIMCNTLFYDIFKEKEHWTIACLKNNNMIHVKAKWVIDATGDGDVAIEAGADYTYGSKYDSVTYWTSLAQYKTSRKYKNNFSSSIYLNDAKEYTNFIRTGRQRGMDNYDFGIYVAPRETRHVEGVYKITLADTLAFKNYHDGIYTCYSNYDPKGKLSADIIYFGFLPAQNKIQIPLRACLPVNEKGGRVPQIIVIGKSISSTHNAFPAIRMQPDLMHQGSVVGMIVAAAVKQSRDVLELDLIQIKNRIQEETGDQLKLPVRLSFDDLLNQLGVLHKTHWVDQPFETEIEYMPICHQILLEEAPKIIPYLKQAFFNATELMIKEQLARYLLWHGDDTGTEFLIQFILDELLSSNGLPRRSGSVVCVTLLPDHGVMPEIIYRLNSLAWSTYKFDIRPYEIIFQRIMHTKMDFIDIHKGLYHYIECIAYAAEVQRDERFHEMLIRLSQLDIFDYAINETNKEDILSQRLLILLLTIYRALYMCDQVEGYKGLVGLTHCYDQIIASSAKKALNNIQSRFREKVW